MNRQQAIKEGAKRYEGTPCKTCGKTLRYVKKGGCVACGKVRRYMAWQKQKQKNKEFKPRLVGNWQIL